MKRKGTGEKKNKEVRNVSVVIVLEEMKTLWVFPQKRKAANGETLQMN